MTRERALKWLLVVIGATALLAIVPVVMPFSWMMAIHAWLGLGEMPEGRIVGYLARSLSAFYAFFGALCLALARDLERYRPLVQLVAILLAVFGIVMTGIDFAIGMPLSWTISEGPLTVAAAAALFVLARPNPQGP